jgi:hypothetical protein
MYEFAFWPLAGWVVVVDTAMVGGARRNVSVVLYDVAAA